jgi:hypothetical protein
MIEDDVFTAKVVLDVDGEAVFAGRIAGRIAGSCARPPSSR